MKFFLDSCDLKAIRKFSELGLVDGVTTNPSIIAKSGRKHLEVIQEICQIVDTSVSVEVLSEDADGMLREAEQFIKLGPQITIKVPLTFDGLKACYALSNQGHSVNVTLCFSPSQALLAAKAGAEYVSPFVGRLDDISHFGTETLETIVQAFENYPNITTQVLAASIRNPVHVMEAALIGADVVTMPPAVLQQMLNHPLTDRGLEIFRKDWEAANA
jgi:transaldolase